MAALLVIVKILYIVLCIALITVVLFQKGRSAGLSGAIAGAGESYWGKNKARTMDGRLQTTTVYLAIGFIIFPVLIQFLAKFV